MESASRNPPWTAEGGLSSEQAQRRRVQDGPNELSPPVRSTGWQRAVAASRDPMLRLLLAAGAVYWILGERSDALILLGFVGFSAGITLFQEQRTEKVLHALRELSSPRALVIRDGQTRRVAGSEVVRGDLLVVSEGDRIAADAVLRESSALSVDESALTGESLPVDKDHQGLLGEKARWIYGGTLMVRGQGVAQVVATGPHSEMGRIGDSLAHIARPAPPLVAQTRHLVRLFSILGGLLSVGVVVIDGLVRGDWLAASLGGITLAMALLPEEFALIIAVFMAMGAWRLSHERVLIRRANALEALGATTVLCSDKTGTLTYNRMEVVAQARWTGATFEASTAPSIEPLPAAFDDLALYTLLASERTPQDPMEKALVRHAQAALTPSALLETLDVKDWTPMHTYGLTAECLAMTRVWRAAHHKGLHPVHDSADELVVATKGAPEAVAALCGLEHPSHHATLQSLRSQTQALAERGWRVLAVARGRISVTPAASGTATEAKTEAIPEARPVVPEHVSDLGLELVGLVALADPLREGVKDSVQECHGAGIRVVMITGDHPSTAKAIAQEAGLDLRAPVITGDTLAQMDETALRETVEHTTVYARVPPAQKLRIVQALRAQGQVVAMTGDGVNDAPSLQAAHIGIAMGGRGTDVAREAASLVLLDDDFTAIVKAMRQGRRVHDNLRKALAFVLAVHVPTAGLALAPLLMGWPLLLFPIHMAFLEMLIDPACSMAFEAEPAESDLMRRPPRDPDAALFPWPLVAWSLMQGLVVLLGVMGVVAWAQRAGAADDTIRATAFCTLVIANAGLILSNRAYTQSGWRSWWGPNAALWRLLAVAGCSLAVVVGWPTMRPWFQFALPPVQAWVAVGVAVLMVMGLLAGLRRWRPADQPLDKPVHATPRNAAQSGS